MDDYCVLMPLAKEGETPIYYIKMHDGSFVANLDKSLEIWLRQNINGNYRLRLDNELSSTERHTYLKTWICFDSEEDAMAFKLSWI